MKKAFLFLFLLTAVLSAHAQSFSVKDEPMNYVGSYEINREEVTYFDLTGASKVEVKNVVKNERTFYVHEYVVTGGVLLAFTYSKNRGGSVFHMESNYNKIQDYILYFGYETSYKLFIKKTYKTDK